MNKLLTSLLMIGVIAGMAGAGTWAYFSDTETSTGNTFTAGTIDLEFNTGTVPFVLEGKPSEVKTAEITVRNVGTNDGVKYIVFEAVADSGGATPNDPELEADPTNLINDISNQIEVDINGVYITDGLGNKLTLADLEDKTIKLGTLPATRIEIDTLSFHIKSDAGNEYQGDVSTFDVTYGLRQVNDDIFVYDIDLS